MTTILKTYMIITNVELWSKKEALNILSIIKKKSLLNHVRGKTEHPSLLVIENDIMKYLLDEEMTKEYAAKNIGGKSIKCMSSG